MQQEVKSIDFSTAGMYYCRLTRTAFTFAVIASVPVSVFAHPCTAHVTLDKSVTLYNIYITTQLDIHPVA